jgi:hypothetical protein
VPEWVLVWALRQLVMARKISRSLEKIRVEQGGATIASEDEESHQPREVKEEQGRIESGFIFLSLDGIAHARCSLDRQARILRPHGKLPLLRW